MDRTEFAFPSGAKLSVRILENTGVEQAFSEISKQFQQSKFQEIFFFFPAEEKERVEWKKLLTLSRNNSIPVFPVDGKKIQEKDFSYFFKLSKFFFKESEKGNLLLVFPESQKKYAEAFLGILYLRPLHKSPEEILKFLFSRDQAEPNEKILYEYLQYLNPEYKIPSHLKLKSSSRNQKKSIFDFSNKYSIRFKLLGIVTIILAFSISLMIYFASKYFKDTSSTMVQDYNLNLSRLIGDVIDSNLENLIYRTELFSKNLARQITNPEKDQFTEDFFQKNPSVVYYVTIESSGGNRKKIVSLFNSVYKKDSPIQEKKLDELLFQQEILFKKSKLGISFLQNLSSEIGYPLLVLYSPSFQETNPTFIFVTPEYFLNSLRASGQTDLFQIHILDSKGSQILSTEKDAVVTEFPIVKKMLSSGIDNGSHRFSYQDKSYLGSFRIIPKFGLGVISTIAEEKAFEAVQRIERKNLFLLFMILSLSFLFVYLFSKTLSIPIVRLVTATKRIESGDYQVDLLPTTQDEIGVLTSSFRSMAKGLLERERIKEEFGKFVNPEIAERALQGDISLGGVKKQCTVFFSDIRSFTSLSESKKPEEVVHILNQYFTAMVECVHATGGVVDKFIGDAVMAHWGAILPESDTERKAVETALLMRKALMELNDKFQKEGISPIRIGCGINSGPVIAGQIGSQKRLEFTVIGDTVNLASRIEYLNKEFGSDILISESTFDALNDEFDCVPMKPISVRGKTNLQKTYAVLGKKTDLQRPKSLSELRATLGISVSGTEAKEEES